MAIQLPRLRQSIPITDDGRPPSAQHILEWQEAMQAIEDALNQILAIPVIEEALALVAAATADAQAAADAANAAAGVAQGAADAAEAQSSLANSYVDANPLSALDAGANTTINIAAHNRIYGNGSSVAVSAGSVTGLAYSTTYWVVYSDPSRTGGAVVYSTVTNEAAAAQTGDTHVVGKITTPAAAAPPASGHPVRPPGAGAIP
jgi:hypothetical protein